MEVNGMSAQSAIAPSLSTLGGRYPGSSALVMTIFSFSMSSRKQPTWGKSRPSGDRITVRKIPPGRKSISHCDVVHGAGAHHFLTCSGSVQACQISDRGASIVRSSKRSSWPLFRAPLAMFLLLALQCGDIALHAVAATFPKGALLRQPALGDAQGRWLHFTSSDPPCFFTADQATVFQHPQMLQQGRHRHCKRFGQFAHRGGAAA